MNKDANGVEAPAPGSLIWDEHPDFLPSYDKKWDVLYVRQEPKQPAVSLPGANGVWFRYDPDTLKVVGIEIEDFEKVFLQIHPDLRPVWRQAKNHVTRPRAASIDELAEQVANLVKKVLEWVNPPPASSIAPA